MFKVGDKLKVESGFTGMSKGTVVTVTRVYQGYAIKEDFLEVITEGGFLITNLHHTRFSLYEEVSLEDTLNRKIRKMYERQPYFLRHRSGQSA